VGYVFVMVSATGSVARSFVLSPPYSIRQGQLVSRVGQHRSRRRRRKGRAERASAERSVRLPGARPTVGTSPRARLIVVRARRPVIRAHARGEDPGAGSVSLSEHLGRKIVFCVCIVCVLEL